MTQVICPYCGGEAQYVDSAVVYGRSYGMIYLCRPCDAYVGVHNGTDIPKGRLANKELQNWKIAAHEAFDPLWKSGQMKRAAAYQWLADLMELPREETHIGMFDIPECMKVIAICNAMKGDFNNGGHKTDERSGNFSTQEAATGTGRELRAGADARADSRANG